MTKLRGSTAAVFTASLATVLAFASTGAQAQQGTLQLTEQEIRPQFGGSVSRVLVDVTVVDDDGNFVPDLTLEDFEVLEEGKAVDVDFFALERFREALPVRPDEDEPARAEGDMGMPESLAEAPLLPRYMVLFIDGFNTAPSDWDNVRFALHQYLDNYLQDNDRVLLATLTPRRRLLVAPEFTRDKGSLKLTIDELTTNPSIKERARRNQQDLLVLLSGATNAVRNFANAEEQGAAEANLLRQGASLVQVFAGERKDEILYTLDAMTALAGHLSRTFDVPGPKTMIMVTAGISQNPGAEYYYILDAQIDQGGAPRSRATSAAEHPVAFRSRFTQTVEQYMVRTIGHLNRLNYTLYTIGARGTSIGAFADSSTTMRSPLSPGIASVAFRTEEDGLRMLSDGTGGLAFSNSVNFAGAFERIDRDTAFRYVLGYTPPARGDKAKPDKFYRIRVKVDRDDVKVRARRGYLDG